MTIPAGGLGDAGWWIAGSRGRGRRLWQHRPVDASDLAQGFPGECSGGRDQGGLQPEPAELDSEVDTGLLLAHYHAKTSAEKTGPSRQDLM